MNCGANVLDELLRFVFESARICEGMEGEVPEGEKD
jgi:hypothetical protein